VNEGNPGPKRLNTVDMPDLIRKFRNEEDCLSYLHKLRWPEGYVCSRCKSTEHWTRNRGLIICRTCVYESSVTAETLFHQDTRKPLRLWFQAIWYLVSRKNGVSALGLQKAIDLGSYHTA
jgi:hypothetical protein